METEKRAKIDELLKSLCINNGWSYGVFWSFNSQNSMLLEMEEAYYKDQMKKLMEKFIDDMPFQVHMLGDGIIGNAAFEKRNQWIFAETYRRDMDPLRYIENHEIFQVYDESKIHVQFSSGIETIAIISVEPHGVVQFGSTLKILETLQFVDQTKLLFREIKNCAEFTLPGSTLSSSNRDIHSLSSLHSPPALSSISGIVDTFNSASSYLGLSGSSTDFFNTCRFISEQPAIKFPDIENQFKMSGPEFPYAKLNDFSFNSPEFLIDFPSNSLSNSVIENDIFPDLESNYDFGEIENIFEGISMPVASGNGLDLSENFSRSISQQCVGSVLSPRESLFSKLGIDHCLDGVTSQPSSFTVSNSDSKQTSKTSSAIKRKRDIFSDSQSCGSSFVSQAKRSEESEKVVKKRSKPGSRPKPKDRQQIQDRISELRKLIPNGVKLSIDSLLAQTIKCMLFWESMTKHAENLKNAEARKDNDYIGTWEFENQVQSMVEPVDVKDLSVAGQKHIKILCKEEGFFLEIVDIIQGFGLNILMGVMEHREDKIWARFIVESEENKYVRKQDIYLSLHQLLSQKFPSEINLCDQLANNCMNGGGSNLFDNYHQHTLQFQTNFSDGIL